MFRLRLAVAAVVLWHGSLVGEICAQTTSVAETAAPPGAEKPTPIDPTGTWKWNYEFGGNTIDAKLKLDWDGKKLKGKYTAFDNTTEIEDAKLEKDEVSFTTNREFNGNEFEVSFKGKVKVDDIDGTVTVDFGDAQEFDWNAKRAVELDDVLGVWNLRLETPNGVVEPRLTITKSDGGLRGEYVSVFGEREPKNLTLKDNELSWELSSSEDDEFDFEIIYKGKPRGNRIEGTNEYDFDGNAGTMKFTGKRTPPKDKQEERPTDEKAAESTAPAKEAQPATDATEAEPAAANSQAEE